MKNIPTVFNKVAYFYAANQNKGTITISDRMNV
ncbi:hypothetical protein LCGC14_2030700 [marine sediment metagenome]|uniref:Uncharacterized protein n=1 Tax=marine sediment metagenome TaxID=412755 RepID=A0A0F9H864_9ZZZZ